MKILAYIACAAIGITPAAALETAFVHSSWRVLCEVGSPPAQSRCTLGLTPTTPAVQGLVSTTAGTFSPVRIRAAGSSLSGTLEQPSSCDATGHVTVDVRFLSSFGDTLRTIHARPSRTSGHAFGLDAKELVALPFDGSLELSMTYATSPSTTTIIRSRYPLAGFRDAATWMTRLPPK